MTSERSRSPQLVEVLKAAIGQRLVDLHVSMPGRVEKYNLAEQKADIKPLLKRPLLTEDGTELEAESLPVLPDVPIVFPRGGGGGTGEFFISWPLAAGDLVHLVFCERSMDIWLSSKDGAEADPVDFRMHDLSDAVAYPGLYPFKKALKDADAANMVLGHDDGGMQLHITDADVAEFRKGGSADVSMTIAETLEAFWTNTVKVWLEAHTHGTGVGPSSPPLNVPAPTWDAQIASDKVKLKDNG